MTDNIIPMKSTITVEKVARYVSEKIVVESSLERDLRLETLRLPQAAMISSSDVGTFLYLLAKSVQSKKAIEVGTFTGYSALKIASALPPTGQLICCDINTEWTDLGRKYWQRADLSSRIDLRLAPAAETLNQLLKQGHANTFDFAFIDADKMGYDLYYEFCLKLIRPGGLIVLDNMLWDGAVADISNQDETTKTLRSLNEKISRDSRVESCLLTVGDGLMLVYKN